MQFLAPLWLIGLIPWAGLAIWLLRGSGDTTHVPFVRLWPSGATAKSSRAFRIPPLAVASMLAAILLWILAAAGPAWGVQSGRSITLIVDRGLTMSATNPSGDRRFVEAAQMLASAIPENCQLDLMAVPSAHPTSGTWQTQVNNLHSTAAIDPQAVRRAVRSAQGPVVLLSEQDLGFQ